MLELVPGGLRRSSAAAAVELAAYTDGRGRGSAPRARSAASRRSPSSPAGRMRWRASTGPCRSGRSGSGRRGRAAAGRRDRRRRSTPAARSAPAPIRRPGSASSCCIDCRAAACSTSAAAPACSSIAAAQLGFAPVHRGRRRPGGGRGDARTRQRTASTSTSALLDAAPTSCPRPSRGREHRRWRRRGACARASTRERRSSRRATSSRPAGARRLRAPAHATNATTAGPPTCFGRAE